MISYVIMLFRLVLFRRFAKQRRLVGLNKPLIDSMSLNFLSRYTNIIINSMGLKITVYSRKYLETLLILLKYMQLLPKHH